MEERKTHTDSGPKGEKDLSFSFYWWYYFRRRLPIRRS